MCRYEKGIDPGFGGLCPPRVAKNFGVPASECIAHHQTAVVLASHHELAKRSGIKLEDPQPLPLTAISEQKHPVHETGCAPSVSKRGH